MDYGDESRINSYQELGDEFNLMSFARLGRQGRGQPTPSVLQERRRTAGPGFEPGVTDSEINDPQAAHRLCSNRAATQIHILKQWEIRH